MGTQVHCKSYLPSYYSMRDLNEHSNSSSWPLNYGDKILPNGQYCNGFMSRTVVDAYPGHDKDILKQKMLEHEAIFKNQVVELHRLYRTQRDMMDEIRRKELHKLCTSMEQSSSSSFQGSQVPSEGARKWHNTSFPLANSDYARPSTSGAEIVISPLSTSKRNDLQSGRNHMHNGSSKLYEVLEARPSKVRKKLFDLQLPADEYIDTEEGEQLQENGGSSYPSYPGNGSSIVAQESGTKLFLGGPGAGRKSDCQKDASISNSCLRSSIGLADLNEPAQLEDATPSRFHCLAYGNNHQETRSINASAKSNPAFVAFPKETTWNSQCAFPNGSLNNIYLDSKGKEREWFSTTHETGNNKGSSAPVSRSLEQDMVHIPSYQAQVMHNKAYQPPGIHPSHHIRDDLWKEKARHRLDTYQRNRELPNYTHVEPFVTSQMASAFTFAGSSEFNSSWSPSVSSWGDPNGSFTRRLSSMSTKPMFNSSAIVSKSSQSSQSHGIFGDNWHVNGSSRLNPGLASELPIQNGFYRGSSSGAKASPICFPSVPFDSLNHTKVDYLKSERSSNNGCEELLVSSNKASNKGFDLNVLSKSALSEELSRQEIDLGHEKREPQRSVTLLPWLKAKENGKNEGTNTVRGGISADSCFVQANSNPPFFQSDTSKNINEICHTQNVASTLEDRITKATKEEGETLENPLASRNESSSLVSTSANFSREGESIRHERRSMVIDINMACDFSMVEPEKPAVVEPLVTEKVMETKASNIRNHFDLNSCFTEDEESVFVETNKANVKTVLEIDLEAPVVLDIEQDNFPGEQEKKHEGSLQLPEHKPEQKQEELVRTAAEAIVSISLSSHHICIEETCSDPSDDPLESLRWFVDVVSSCADELDNTSNKETIGKDGVMVKYSASEEIDSFEAMTLQLTETKEEDYMPKPFLPEVQTVEDAGASSLTNRTRRGYARRGRQRRDFQRDILPGLVSLSRHEVTEDLQTFGGLMRATGHTWNFGSTRRNGTRNGGARGRRKTVVESTPAAVSTPISTPLVHQLNNIESSLENKSLTGWGKTTRRPRRQRCPAGNPSAILLT